MSCPTTRAWLPPEILTNQFRTQNRIFNTGRLLFQYCADTAVQLSFGYSRVKIGVCERVCKQHVHHCWLIYRPATGHGSGWIRVLPGSRPVNSRPAKRQGCVITAYVNEALLLWISVCDSRLRRTRQPQFSDVACSVTVLLFAKCGKIITRNNRPICQFAIQTIELFKEREPKKKNEPNRNKQTL
jgi:hypothetical protein